MGAGFDAVVIGAGFGGIGAALRLVEAGARVCVLESLNYPGGCASTFSRSGYRFEAGATLFSGFGPGQLFSSLIERHGLDVEVDMLDPMVRLRTPEHRLEIGPDREALRAALVAEGTPAGPLDRFFAEQRAVADALWALFDDPAWLPPFDTKTLLRHVGRAGRYAPILPLIGRPLGRRLERLGLGGPGLFRTYLDAACQITVQCSAGEAEAPFAMSTLDYYHHGTGHVRGGIGRLATALTDQIRALGGQVRFATRAKGLRRARGHWVVDSRGGEVRAPAVIANLLPQNVQRLLEAQGQRSAALDEAARRVTRGWGAAMLYLVVKPPRDAKADAVHLELVADPNRPLVEGNHVFCSISGAQDEGRAPDGLRTMTVSTHVPLAEVLDKDDAEQARYYARVQADMRRTIERLAPEWVADVRHEMTGSPRTFERFTGRAEGFVGGVPRRAGLHNYAGLVPASPSPGLYLVGDSVFPGQSTLATTLGGMKAADRALGSLRAAVDGVSMLGGEDAAAPRPGQPVSG